MTVRIGILGAARIAPNAIVKPARRVDGAEVVAVAARDSVATMRAIDAIYRAAGFAPRPVTVT